MFWLNGKRADSITLTDRSFQYGDGCFTTMLTRNGQIQHWQKHIDRMNACLDVLLIPRPDWKQVEKWLDQAVRSEPLAGVKIHISRGAGGRGYSPTQVTSPNVTISAFIYPPHYEQWSVDGVNLGVCQTRLGLNPMLAGHKHNNRLEQIMVKAELDDLQLPDGVVLDINGNVIETSMANLFWVKGGVVYTPALTHAGVSGVMRRVVLEVLEKMQIRSTVGHFELDSVLAADEVFISNSILGVAPIRQISSANFEIGTITKRIQETIDS